MAKEKPSILIVDDEKNTREGLERALRREYRVATAESGDTALELMAEDPPDILLTDLRMPGMDGLTLVQRALARHPNLVCLLLTAYGSVETAVEAMKRGAHDYLTKPVNLDELELVLKRALRSQKVETENANLHKQLDDKYGVENIIGNSPAMAQLFDTIRQAAPTQATVLVQGDSGTGKELVAHAVHRLSNRARGPFVAVHCAALSMNLLESELFGHEKGAFTGAMSRRKGRFELADGGTLFLDEISEIDASIQVKLLRVLEERQFERVGGDETIETDIRLITATNKDLKTLVKEGKFREDLFFRLDVVNITLPPLRERIGDVAMLCRHFLDEFNQSNGREIDGFTPDAVTILSSYNWPGNVRELRNTIEKMVVLSRGNRLTARDVPANIRETVKAAGPSVVLPSGGTMRGGDSLAATEQRMIMATLEKLNGNRTKAAEELGISRRTLHRKLKQYEEDAAAISGD
jgi:DNA-binding NtrC family response regulator